MKFRWLAIGILAATAVVVLPAGLRAQEIALSGTVTDTTPCFQAPP